MPNQFNGSISKSAVNLEKIGRGQIFGLSRDTPTSRPDRAKISHFQNLFRFIQYGCHSFSIDASSDPTKFQDDWPSGSRLIGAWSSDFAFNVFVCQVEPLARSIFFGRKLILKVSTVPNQFNGSISKSAVNLEKIGRGQIFGLSRDTPTSRPDRAKISHFQNLFRFIQYGCHSFSIDASSDPTKFQDDWPSGSRLIGAWSSDFAFNVFVCQVEPLARSIFFGRKLILKVSTVPNQFNGSISKSAVNLEKIGRGQIFGLSRDTPTSRPDRAKISHFQNLFRFIQYGCHSFSIDASSDPTKFQDDWPSGSRLIGAWSSDFAFNVFVCQVEPLARSIFFGRKLILKVSTVPNQFNGSISKSAVNLEKIGRGQIFGLSRDTPTSRPDRAKISHFQNLFRFIQYGCHSFSIDASSDPTKFQDDWPSGSRLIGAWSSDFAFNVFVCQVEPLARSIFFRPEIDFKGFYRAKSVQWVDI